MRITDSLLVVGSNERISAATSRHRAQMLPFRTTDELPPQPAADMMKKRLSEELYDFVTIRTRGIVMRVDD